MAEEQIYMKHESSGPDTEPARVSKRAFERSWSKRGWRMVTELGTAPEPVRTEESTSEKDAETEEEKASAQPKPRARKRK